MSGEPSVRSTVCEEFYAHILRCMKTLLLPRFVRRVWPASCLILLLALSACSGLPVGGGGNATPTTAPTTVAQQPTLPTGDPSQLLNRNLIVNGDAEAATGSPDDTALVAIPGWTRQGNFNVMQYQSDSNDYQGTTSAGPAKRGKNFFYGGLQNETDNTTTSASQTIDISAGAALFVTNQVKFTLSGWLGGFGGQNDSAKLTIQFLSVTGQALSSASIGPVMDADRKGETCLVERTTDGTVPAGTVKITVTLTMTKTDGSDNDGSADNLSLIFHP